MRGSSFKVRGKSFGVSSNVSFTVHLLFSCVTLNELPTFSDLPFPNLQKERKIPTCWGAERVKQDLVCEPVDTVPATRWV